MKVLLSLYALITYFHAAQSFHFVQRGTLWQQSILDHGSLTSMQCSNRHQLTHNPLIKLACAKEPEPKTRLQLASKVDSAGDTGFSGARLIKQTITMALSGAALGPFLDGYHSAFGVLAYTKPISVVIGGLQFFQTDYWVPPMFALAAVILGLSYPFLDSVFAVPSASRTPTAPSVFYCISYFSFQYYLSGLLFSQGCSPMQLHAVLAATAAICWAVFDRTPTGAVMSTVTGLAGPAVEIALLNGAPLVLGGALYHYTEPDLLGIPVWIAWVYACGAPAVGNLARLFWARR